MAVSYKKRNENIITFEIKYNLSDFIRFFFSLTKMFSQNRFLISNNFCHKYLYNTYRTNEI